jgi:hypothetical protein
MTVNGVTIISGGTRSPVPGSAASNYDNPGLGDSLAQFCEAHFPQLRLVTSAVDAKGLAAHKWQLNGKDISGVYNTAVLLASSNNGTAWALLTDVNNSKYIGFKADDTVSYFLNGATSSLGAVQTAASSVGQIIDFYDTDFDNLYDKVCVNSEERSQAGCYSYNQHQQCR